jgi:hypothetical protein
LNRRDFTSIELTDDELGVPIFTSLDAFRPLVNARPNRRSPRRSGVNFSSSFTAGCVRIMPSTFFATTPASGCGLRKFGKKWN